MSIWSSIKNFFYNPDSARAYKEWNDSTNKSFLAWLTGAAVQPGNTVGSMLNKVTGAGLTGAEQQANQFNAEQAALQRDWEERMSNSSYQRAVADMQAAGLNPALMYGHGVGASTPSGSSASSVTPFGGSSVFDMIMQLKQLQIQDRLASADVTLKTAQANKTDKESSWIDSFNQLKVRSLELENKLTEEQTTNLIQQRDLVVKQIDHISQSIAESDSRILLNKANEWLSKANAKEILELLPYNIALTDAKTESEQAAAFLDWINHAREVKLLDSDYYDNLIRQSGYQADQLKVSADRSHYDYILHSGQHLNGVGSRLFHGLQTFGEATQGLGALLGLATGIGVAKISASAKGREKRPVKVYNNETGEPYTVWR